MSEASRKIVRRKQLSGAAKAKAYSRKLVMVSLRPEEHALLQRAAIRDHRSLSGFIRGCALRLASELLGDAGEAKDYLSTQGAAKGETC